MFVFSTRGRKALEQRSMADEERIDFLESHLKEAKYIAEDADHKYDEVNTLFAARVLSMCHPCNV